MIEAQEVPAIVAEVEEPAAETQTTDAAQSQAAQLAEFDRRIRDLEAAIGDLRNVSAAAIQTAAAAPKAAAASRKTLPAHAEALLSKHAVAPEVQAAGLDAALASLSIEQRIAVKSQMLRAGLL